MRGMFVFTLFLFCLGLGCGDRAGSAKQVAQSNAANSAEESKAEADAVPNPIYPIEVSIAGNAPLQQAAAAAEARSKALDEICKGLEMSDDLSAQQPPGGGCPRAADSAIGAEAEVSP